MRRRLVWLLALAAVAGAVSVGAVTGYSISIDGSYDTPPETVTVEGEEFTVTALKSVRPGENLTVHVTAPADDEYQINIYTVDEHVQDFRLGNGNETVQFETGVLDPGSYVVAAVDNEEFYAVHPVVVTDYTIDVSVPDSVGADESFDATVSLDALSGQTTPGEVELVFWNEATRERLTMTKVDDGTYETTVSGLASGTYDVYAVVVGEERVGGEENIVGVSRPLTVEIDDSDGTTPTTTPTDSSTVTPTDTRTVTPTEARTATATPPPSPTTDDGVITPGNSSTPGGDGDGAGFGVGVTLVAVLGSALLVGRRHS